MSSVAAVLQALLVLFLIVVFPLWDRRETARLKASTDPRARVRSYQVTIAWQIVAVAILLLTIPARSLFTPPDAGALGVKLDRGALLPILVGLSAGVILPVVILKLKARGNPRMANAANPLDAIAFILPRSRAERWWFAAVCVTVGVCEEIIFRGFMIRWFHDLPPRPSLVAAVLLSAAVFGIDHGYQGWKGILGTFMLALVMTALFFVTGTLWVPVAVHALIDLRALLMLPADTSPAPEDQIPV